MLKKIKGFLKSKKGAELVEIILGVVIAVALCAVTVTFIYNTINSNIDKHSGGGSVGDLTSEVVGG